MNYKELWVNRHDYRETKIISQVSNDLKDGQVRVAINQFALTANNVTYAVSADMIGYWRFFPAEDEAWGKVTVWGIAEVIESHHDDVCIGERIYGFFPMAEQLIMSPSKVRDQSWIDGANHRTELPNLYNTYSRIDAEPKQMMSLINERCVLFPLYMTGFIIADYLLDNDYFNVDQIIISSASSKTGYATMARLKDMGFKGRIVALTSSKNIEFVLSLGVANEVKLYEDAATVMQLSSVYIDMSGNHDLTLALHNRLQEHLTSSLAVGATHWDAKRKKRLLPGTQPQLFFAPSQFSKRAKEWGVETLQQRAFIASAAVAQRFKELCSIDFFYGLEEAQQLWGALLNNEISGQRGLIIKRKCEGL